MDRCALKAGETLFVTGATGGVGLSVIDLGRALGARVIAGIGDDAKADAAREAGAEAVVNYRQQDLWPHTDGLRPTPPRTLRPRNTP